MDTNKSDEFNWALRGLAAEEKELTERLTFIRSQLSARRSSGMTGTSKPRQAKPATTGPSKGRQVSDEHRRKLSESAKRRWATRKGEQVPAAETETTTA